MPAQRCLQRSEAADAASQQSRRTPELPHPYMLLSLGHSRIGSMLEALSEVVIWVEHRAACREASSGAAQVADVLVGFSLPRTLELESKGSLHEYHEFKSIHALIMWAVIPPVIAGMFSSYVMFGFIAMLHILDILATRDRHRQLDTSIVGMARVGRHMRSCACVCACDCARVC